MKRVQLILLGGLLGLSTVTVHAVNPVIVGLYSPLFQASGGQSSNSNGAEFANGTTYVSWAVTTSRPVTGCAVTGTDGSGYLQPSDGTNQVWYDTVGTPPYVTALAPGFYLYNITCTAADGGSGSAPLPITFSVHSLPPPLEITAVAIQGTNGTPLTSPLPAGTNAVNIVFNTNETASCTVDNNPISPLILPTAFTYNVNGLTNGFAHTYTIACQDPVNGTSANTTLSLSVQNANPVTVGLVSPLFQASGGQSSNSNGAAFANGTTYVSWAVTTSRPVTGCAVTGTDGSGYLQPSDGTNQVWYDTVGTPPYVTALAPGFYLYNITCTAADGGSGSAPLPITFSVHSLPPPLEITAVAIQGTNGTPLTSPLPAGTNAVNIVFNTNETASCTVDNNPISPLILPTAFTYNVNGLTNGFAHTYTIACQDPVNGTSANTTLSLSVQNANPVTVGLVSPLFQASGGQSSNSNGAAFANGTTYVSWAVTTSRPVTGCAVSGTGAPGRLQPSDGTNQVWYDTVGVPPYTTPITAGPYTFNVTCTAGDGGSGSLLTPISFTVNPPSPTISCTPTGGTTYPSGQTVACTSSDQSAFILYWNFNGGSSQSVNSVNGSAVVPAPGFNQTGTWYACAQNATQSAYWPAAGGCNAPAGYAIQPSPSGTISLTISPSGPYLTGEPINVLAVVSGAPTIDHIVISLLDNGITYTPSTCTGPGLQCAASNILSDSGPQSFTAAAYDSSNNVIAQTAGPTTIQVSPQPVPPVLEIYVQDNAYNTLWNSNSGTSFTLPPGTPFSVTGWAQPGDGFNLTSLVPTLMVTDASGTHPYSMPCNSDDGGANTYCTSGLFTGSQISVAATLSAKNNAPPSGLSANTSLTINLAAPTACSLSALCAAPGMYCAPAAPAATTGTCENTPSINVSLQVRNGNENLITTIPAGSRVNVYSVADVYASIFPEITLNVAMDGVTSPYFCSGAGDCGNDFLPTAAGAHSFVATAVIPAVNAAGFIAIGNATANLTVTGAPAVGTIAITASPGGPFQLNSSAQLTAVVSNPTAAIDSILISDDITDASGNHISNSLGSCSGISPTCQVNATWSSYGTHSITAQAFSSLNNLVAQSQTPLVFTMNSTPVPPAMTIVLLDGSNSQLASTLTQTSYTMPEGQEITLDAIETAVFPYTLTSLSGTLTVTDAAGGSTSSPLTCFLTAASGSCQFFSFTGGVHGQIYKMAVTGNSTAGIPVNASFTLNIGPTATSCSTQAQCTDNTTYCNANNLCVQKPTANAAFLSPTSAQIGNITVGNPVLIEARADIPAYIDVSMDGVINQFFCGGDANQIDCSKSITFNTPGSYTFTAHADVPAVGGSVLTLNSTSLTFTVKPVSPAPVITSDLAESGQVGQPFNYQITATNSPTSFNATGLPAGLSVNTVTGAITGTPTGAGSSNVTISASNTGGPGSATLVLTVSNPPPPPPVPVITSDLAESGQVGQPFNYQITATNSPTSFNATGLPAGLSVNTVTGAITGTPTGAGSSNVTISASNTGGPGSATLVLTVSNPPPPPPVPVITSDLAESGQVGQPFNYQITATNSPTSFNATGLPAGLSVNTVTGAITGTPTGAGSSNVTISASNTGGPGSATLVLTVSNPPPPPPVPVITSDLAESGQVGQPFNYQITATNSPTSFNATGLPAGLSVNTVTGAITGTPTGAGSSNVTISASNTGGPGSATLVLTVSNPPPPPPVPVITSDLAESGQVGQPFNYQITATNSPTSFNATGLPAGLSVNTVTGAITGTPTGAGSSNVTISASNTGGPGSAILVLTITSLQEPVITSPLTADAVVGQPFNYQITASNNPTGFSATGLPAGLSVDANTGAITGTPTSAGSSQVALSATNVNTTATATLSLTVLPLSTVSPPLTPNLSSLDGKTFSPADTIVLPYTGSATSFNWEFVPQGGAASVRAIGASSASDGSLASLSSPSPSLALSTLSIPAGAYVLSVQAVANGQASGWAKANITWVTAVNLNAVAVFPNPFRAARGDTQINFQQLPATCTVKIFTVSGKWVKTLNASSGQALWDLTNDSGERAASGLYVYLVTDNQGNKIRGKLAVIR